jgi:hypothetical protein
MLHGSADIFYLPFQSKSGTTRLRFILLLITYLLFFVCDSGAELQPWHSAQ